MSEPFNPAFQRALDATDPAYRVIVKDVDDKPAPRRRPKTRRTIRLSLRGYDVGQVDELLTQAEAALVGGSEARRAWARQALRSTRLQLSTPGYSRSSVHNVFNRLSCQLGGCEGPVR